MAQWSLERIELIKARWGEGCSASQIARELGGVTRNAVIGKLSRLGLTGRSERAKAHRTGSQHRALGRRAHLTKAERVMAAARRRRAATELAQNIEATDLPEDRSDFAVSFFEVARGQCRWPLGDPSDLAGFRFCGAPQVNGESYCARHAALAGQGSAHGPRPLSPPRAPEPLVPAQAGTQGRVLERPREWPLDSRLRGNERNMLAG